MRQFLPLAPSPYAFEACIPLSLEACQARLRQRWIYEYETGIGCELVDLLVWYESDGHLTRYYVTLGAITVFGYLRPVNAEKTWLSSDFLYVPWWQVPRLSIPAALVLGLLLLGLLKGLLLSLLCIPLIGLGILLQEWLVERHKRRLVKLLPCLWLEENCRATLPRLRHIRR